MKMLILKVSALSWLTLLSVSKAFSSEDKNAFSSQVNNVLNAEDIPEPITLCSGAGMGAKWNGDIQQILTTLFNRVGLRHHMLLIPAKRAEYEFQRGQCAGFFAGPEHLPEALSRTDIFSLKDKMLTAKLELYTGVSNPIKSEQHFSQIFSHKGTTVAYFSTLTLSQFMAGFEHVKSIGVTTLEQGFGLLEKNRVEYFVFPEIVNGYPDAFESLKKPLKRVNTMVTVDLYFWFDRSLLPYKEPLEQALFEMKSEGLLKRISSDID